jgi:hypothetical protein
MAKRATRNVDFITYYRNPAEASLPELHVARWVLRLFLANSARRSEVPPIDELLAVAGKLLVWGRSLLDAGARSSGIDPLAPDERLDRAHVAASPLPTVAEGESDCLHPGLRTLLKSPRWCGRLVRDSLRWIGRVPADATVGHRNVDWLADSLRLPAFDRELLKLTVLRYEWRGVGDYLSQLAVVSIRDAARLVAAALEVEEHVVLARFGRDGALVRYGLLDPSEPLTDLGDVLRLAPHFADALTQRHERPDALLGYLLQEAPPPVLARKDCAHLDAEIEAARRLLTNARV